MRFDHIKRAAQHEFVAALTRGPTDAHFRAMLDFARMAADCPAELREFAAKLDSLAGAHKLDTDDTLSGFWRRVEVAAREEGLRRIEAWDVRSVGALLRAFPKAAPSLAGKRLVCEIADDERGDWIVEAAD